jgi:hypothetical protein
VVRYFGSAAVAILRCYVPPLIFVVFAWRNIYRIISLVFITGSLSLRSVRGISRIILNAMLMAIVTILVILWLLGVVGVYSIGSFIHILLALAVISVLIRIIYGEHPFGSNP